VSLPSFNAVGDLPPGVHRGTLREVLARLGQGSPRRVAVGSRLGRIDHLARSTGHLARLVVFGSFVTDKPEPNDVDVFLLMKDSFDVNAIVGETRLVFDHAAADAHFGASVFWTRRLAAFGGEQAAIEFWQTKRDGNLRGIVEIESESP
jgi:hypothetical protein